MFQPDIILNASGQATQNSPNKELWQANTTNVINLLEACRVLPKVKFVQCSSIVCDDSVNTMYAASKLSAEHICRSYAKMYNNIHSYKFRFPAVVGAANRHGVVKDVVRKLKSDSDKLQLFGNEPGSKKPYVYAEQITRHILEYVNETDYKCGLYHLCPADIISVKEIAEIAMKKTGIYKEIEWRADAVWTHDKQLVLPTGSNFHMLSSYEATEKGIDDILREDYNETAN